MTDSNVWRPHTNRVAATLVGLLSDEGRKPPRVLARKIADHLDALDMLSTDTPAPELDGPEGHLVLLGEQPDPPTWLQFAETIDPDDTPIAVTRDRTDMAIRHLGLDPNQVRALVVERDWLRVYRWSDRTTAQTMPILEEPA